MAEGFPEITKAAATSSIEPDITVAGGNADPDQSLPRTRSGEPIFIGTIRRKVDPEISKAPVTNLRPHRQPVATLV